MRQSTKLVTSAAAIAAAAGLAITGASLASATDTTAPVASSYGESPGQQGTAAPDPSKATHPGETLLTGTIKERVTAAAKAKEPTATIERVESDAEGVYEAHMVRADGTHITVKVDKNFAVTAVQAGGPGGPGGPGAAAGGSAT